MTARLVTGHIVETGVSTAYQGEVWERWIRIVTETGEELVVSDFPLVDVPLLKGSTYDLVVHANDVYGLTFPLGVNDERGELAGVGTVAEVNWRPSDGQFSHVAADLFKRSWVIVELPVGGVLVSPTEFDSAPVVGDRVGWKNARYDLLAIA
jgi:hypothetical protein